MSKLSRIVARLEQAASPKPFDKAKWKAEGAQLKKLVVTDWYNEGVGFHLTKESQEKFDKEFDLPANRKAKKAELNKKLKVLLKNPDENDDEIEKIENEITDIDIAEEDADVESWVRNTYGGVLHYISDKPDVVPGEQKIGWAWYVDWGSSEPSDIFGFLKKLMQLRGLSKKYACFFGCKGIKLQKGADKDEFEEQLIIMPK